MEQEKGSPAKKTSEDKSRAWTWVLLGMITLIFIGAVLIFVGGWWLYKNKVNESLEIVQESEEYAAEDSWINDLDSYFIDDDELDNIADEVSEEPNIINGTEKFVSNEFGFTLNFTDNWQDYKAELIVDDVVGQEEYLPQFEEDVSEDEIDQLQQGFVASYVFYYPSEQDDLFRTAVEGYADVFSLDIFRLDEYNAIQTGNVLEIGRNNRYIFTYSNYYYPQETTDFPAPEDISQAVLTDIDSIAKNIETFDVRVLE